MKYKGPILTLAAGLVLAAVLMVLNLRVTSQHDAANESAQTSTDATQSAAPNASGKPAADKPATSAPPTQASTVDATYAGHVSGGGATIAIAAKDGKAVAYLCDGNRTEAWLQGSARNGELTLRGTPNASLTGSYTNGVARGTVTAAGRKFTFAVKVVKPPSGLYRATANVRNADVVGGWIVLEDGEQVGVMDVAGEPRPAGPLDMATASTVVDGTTVTAAQVDPSRGL